MARSRSPEIPGEHVEVAYRVVGYATVSGPPETCRSPQLSATSGFACAAIQQLRAVHRPERGSYAKEIVCLTKKRREIAMVHTLVPSDRVEAASGRTREITRQRGRSSPLSNINVIEQHPPATKVALPPEAAARLEATRRAHAEGKDAGNGRWFLDDFSRPSP